MTTPKIEPRAAARTRVPRRVPLGVVTAGDPSQKPGQRSGVNGPGPPRPAGGRGARGGPPGRGLALPGLAGEFAQKPRPAARFAKRRSLSRVPALPAPGHDRPWAAHPTVCQTDRQSSRSIHH